MTEDRGVDGVLLVRVWFERPGDWSAFRARVTRSIDLHTRETVIVSTPEDLVDEVRSWLRAFVRP